MAHALESLAEYQRGRVRVLWDYYDELHKPGFKHPNQWIIAGTSINKHRATVITPTNTWQGDSIE